MRKIEKNLTVNPLLRCPLDHFLVKFFKGGCYYRIIFTTFHRFPICLSFLQTLYRVLYYGNPHRLFLNCLILMQVLDDVPVLLYDGQRVESSYALHSHCIHWYQFALDRYAYTPGIHSCHASLLARASVSIHHCHRTYASVVWFCIHSLSFTSITPVSIRFSRC
ncbi:HNH endonuclease [Bacillus cereus Rock3-42]|nr:HNH endonuclease [Bacillus cereus Rock3-42]